MEASPNRKLRIARVTASGLEKPQECANLIPLETCFLSLNRLSRGEREGGKEIIAVITREK